MVLGFIRNLFYEKWKTTEVFKWWKRYNYMCILEWFLRLQDGAQSEKG